MNERPSEFHISISTIVLPSFEVKLIPGSAFFYVDSEELQIDIKAMYVKL